MSKTNTINWDSNLYQDKHSFVFKYGEDLLNLLAPKKGEHILDLGCGTGQLTAKIAGAGAITLGIDSSPEMIDTAKKNFPKLDFKILDATSFDLPDRFDAVFSNAVLHWVNEKEKAIDCIYQSLKTGGRMVVEFGGKGNNKYMIQALKKAFEIKGINTDFENKLWYFPSIAEYTTLLEQRGFEVTFAALFDRPTKLADINNGPKDWFKMFGEKFFKGMDDKVVEEVLNITQELLIPTIFIDGNWYADYKRIRIVAYKP